MKRKYLSLIELIITTAFLGFFITQFYHFDKLDKFQNKHFYYNSLAYEFIDSAFNLIKSSPEYFIEKNNFKTIFKKDIKLDLIENAKGKIKIETKNKLYLVNLSIDYLINNKKFSVKVVDSIEK